ncbi:MAG: sigma-54 interaction domain-containing protein [Candidatus Entotheonellia bacterium]
MQQPHILILDAEHGHALGTQIQAILGGERAYMVDLRANLSDDEPTGKAARPALLIAVLPVSRGHAIACLGLLQSHLPNTPLLPVLQEGSLSMLLDHLGHRTMDFLVPPLRAAEVHARVQRCLASGATPPRDRRCAAGSESVWCTQLVGEAPPFVAMKQQLPRLAQVEAPVLISGETGTGKELCARALHYFSRRAVKPFLPVNCSALPADLFERELFGHAKGAFTGAHTSQPGLIAEAEGGTLFLDEIETLGLQAQAKLLRFLQDQTYYVLGSPRLQQADVWILAATNTELSHMVQEGTFRADLFYRLAVMTLTLPPLRERVTDIPRLVAYFGARYAAQQGQAERLWSPQALTVLCDYAWPGNVRELANVVQQVLALTDAATIEPADLPLPLRPSVQTMGSGSMRQTKAQVIAQFERSYLAELLQAHQGNVTHAARAAQKERRAFRRLLRKYNLTPR